MASTGLSEAELHHNRAPELAASVGSFLTLSIVTVCMRVYVRAFMAKSFGFDDVMIVFCLINYMIYAIFVFTGIHFGTGQHTAALSAFNYSHAMKVSIRSKGPMFTLLTTRKMWYFCEIFYGSASLLVRISIAALILRLTAIPWHKYLLYGVMTVSTAMGVTLIFELLFQCQPIGFFWSATRNPLHGHCIDNAVTVIFVYVHGAISCACDWILGILPWLLVKDLNMNRRTKWVVGLLLCFANFGSIAMLVRFYTVRQIATQSDFLYATVDLAIWSNLEIGVAIPAVSLITLRPLFRSFLKSGKTTGNSGLSGAQYRGGTGYVRHNESASVRLKELERMKDIERGTTGKGMTATTITTGDATLTDGFENEERGWKYGSSHDTNSDEQPLQITKVQGVDISYDRAVSR
ncbi:putative integral membrane [Phaeomoniella chlamydospora]|uniref:Putative integral membrane n=1 Tax=Phaeomoniella chlamydospora TaxID=158046 RepID=A0A0G2DV90_PHACM|nr:putative integral membrane [Phaeomoniella chlamydospora]